VHPGLMTDWPAADRRGAHAGQRPVDRPRDGLREPVRLHRTPCGAWRGPSRSTRCLGGCSVPVRQAQLTPPAVISGQTPLSAAPTSRFRMRAGSATSSRRLAAKGHLDRAGDRYDRPRGTSIQGQARGRWGADVSRADDRLLRGLKGRSEGFHDNRRARYVRGTHRARVGTPGVPQAHVILRAGPGTTVGGHGDRLARAGGATGRGERPSETSPEKHPRTAPPRRRARPGERDAHLQRPDNGRARAERTRGDRREHARDGRRGARGPRVAPAASVTSAATGADDMTKRPPSTGDEPDGTGTGDHCLTSPGRRQAEHGQRHLGSGGPGRAPPGRPRHRRATRLRPPLREAAHAEPRASRPRGAWTLQVRRGELCAPSGPRRGQDLAHSRSSMGRSPNGRHGPGSAAKDPYRQAPRSRPSHRSCCRRRLPVRLTRSRPRACEAGTLGRAPPVRGGPRPRRLRGRDEVTVSCSRVVSDAV